MTLEGVVGVHPRYNVKDLNYLSRKSKIDIHMKDVTGCLTSALTYQAMIKTSHPTINSCIPSDAVILCFVRRK